MPNQLDVSADQTLATRRHDLEGVAYLLSGTLKGRATGIADVDFYWGTHNVTAPLGVGGADISFEAYLARPIAIQRGLSFDPRGGPSTPAVRVPIYNYAFAHATSLLAAITDEDFSWENTQATLRVGYLKPGQTPDDLAAADWTPVVLDGFFGAPQDIQFDAFNVVLYGRGANRNQAITQRVISGPAQPGTASVGVDKADVGKPYPIVVGRPDRWFKPPTLAVGVRGFTVSGYSAGATTIQISPIVSGAHMLKTGGGVNTTKISIHHRTPVYELTSGFGDVVFDEDNELLTFELASGLSADVPRGAYVQEAYTPNYKWALADYRLLPTITDSDKLDGYVGFRFGDGRIVPADLSSWPFEVRQGTGGPMDDKTTYLQLPWGNSSNPNVPVFFEPNDPNAVAVTQQPAFTATVNMTGKLNFGTGGAGGTNNSYARDGSDQTAMTLTGSEVATITFNSIESPFSDGDTTASILHIIKGPGTLTLTNSIGSVTFANVATAAGTYHYVQVAARDFNETIRIVAGGSGGSVFEIWWEHDATTQDAATRTDDVAVGTGVSGAVGEVMQFADVVFRMPKLNTDSVLLSGVISASGTLETNPWRDTETTGAGFPTLVSWPAAAMAGLQGLLLGDAGRLDSIAQDSYDAAHAKHEEHNIRWNFVLQEKLRSWTELEQSLAEQSRTYMQYGPSGHEMVFQEAASGLEIASVQQEFRYEGVPGANAQLGNGPIIERTQVSEIRNAVDVIYAPDVDGVTQRELSLTDADSVALFGERRDPLGRFNFWAHSQDLGNPNYDVDTSVSGIAAYMLERYAFAHTRFRFRSAWIAYGVDRGSLVRIGYRVGDALYRNVLCEVEEIKTNPPDMEKVDLVCRSVASPQFGFTAAFTWADVFPETTDAWTDKITSTLDRWDQHWAVPEE